MAHLPQYLGKRNGVLAKERGDEWKKSDSLCMPVYVGGDYLLKALGSVASYLADRLLNMSNDNKPTAIISRGHAMYCDPPVRSGALHWPYQPSGSEWPVALHILPAYLAH